MIVPGRLDLVAFRFTPFVTPLVITGIDLTGAAFAAQVRDRWNGGALRVDLTTVGSVATEGITLVSATTIAGVSYSTLSLRIDEATMEAMPEAPEFDGDLELVWDMHITPLGGVKAVYLSGKFSVLAGSTE